MCDVCGLSYLLTYLLKNVGLFLQTRLNLTKMRDLHVELLWNMTESLNVLYPKQWTRLAIQILDSYTQELYDTKILFDKSGDQNDEKAQWNFGEALLYSVTVITTIGQFAYHPVSDLERKAICAWRFT